MSLITPAVQDVLASKFASELEYGVDNYPDGTMPEYEELSNYFLEKAKAAARSGHLTFSHLMLGQLYRVLMTTDEADLRHQLTGLLAQGLQWREALDRRVSK